MNNTSAITQAEMAELIEPIYRVIGSAAALFVILVAAALVLYPFLRKKIL